ncbi:uncharacterized protein LOC142765111 [Rhipicephalus microplus]|uniref:uncharacterized protein LOC142765111 n=1 Tax=Rhipicephalus microplus TaxID=6941 RepID=UPI003F6CA036
MAELPEQDHKPHPSDIKAAIGQFELTTSNAGHPAESAASSTGAAGVAAEAHHDLEASPASLVPPSARSPTVDTTVTPLEHNLSKEALCGSRAAKDSNDVSMTTSALQRMLSPAGPSTPPGDVQQQQQKKLEVVIMGTKSPKKLKRQTSSPGLGVATSPNYYDDDDLMSTTSSITAFRERLRDVRLEVVRHKGLIATTVVAMFCFATYFLLVAVIMIAMYVTAERPEDRVAARMGLNPVNIAVTLMAMGVGCSALALSLAYAIEDISWG